MRATGLTPRQREILEYIETSISARGFPPSVREIGEAVGLNSPSTVHNHLETLTRLGYLVRDPSKPRAMLVRYDSGSGAAIERRPVRHVPLVGSVAAGVDVLAEENVEEVLPLPLDFTGDGDLFMLKVRGDSMVDAGILDGDYVVARQQHEATVKTWQRKGNKVTLIPHNPRLEPMTFDAGEVEIYGKVVTLLRRLD